MFPQILPLLPSRPLVRRLPLTRLLPLPTVALPISGSIALIAVFPTNLQPVAFDRIAPIRELRLPDRTVPWIIAPTRLARKRPSTADQEGLQP